MSYDFRDAQFAFIMSSNGTTIIENDSMGKPIYIGYADAGTATSTARWQIRKLTYDANNAVTNVQFASGVNTFNKIWDSRADYEYS